ncbi:MAG: hypothetical protein FJX67_06665 [Alphaproteobacteria bacterium]|nr:hypothetical protein [Alphaproteobacteria bacterium]
MLKDVLARWRPPPITDAPALRTYAKQNAAFIAQKSSIDYCRVKAGTFSYQLFTEKEFLDALTRCRWEGFALVLADILIVIEAFLRPPSDREARTVAARLMPWYADILATEPIPAHRPDGWGEAVTRFEARFAAAVAKAPGRPADIARVSGQALYAVLPIHTNHRELDQDMVVAGVQFRMVSLWQTMERRVDRAAVCDDLLGGPPR